MRGGERDIVPRALREGIAGMPGSFPLLSRFRVLDDFEGAAGALDLGEDLPGQNPPPERLRVAVGFSMKFPIASTRLFTERNDPRRSCFSVSSRNHRSTMFSHELPVGVKWRWNRLCRASHLFAGGLLCVA